MTSTLALAGLLAGAGLHGQDAAFDETYTTDPAARGWFATGTTNLFQWNVGSGALDVTWDSREPNSYFARPLGTVLTRTNDFCLVFDLKLADFTPNIDPAKNSGPFELGIGLINLTNATAAGFSRGGGNCPNLLDFAFFPDQGGPYSFGPSLTGVLVDRTSAYEGWLYADIPLALTTNDVFRVTMSFNSTAGTLRVEVLQNGASFGTLPSKRLPPGFTDFALDHLAVCSYSDTGQYPGWEGSLLAHGSVDNLSFAPWLPVKNLTAVRLGNAVAVRCDSHTGWLYTLERATDRQGWEAVSAPLPGTGAALILTDSSPPAPQGLYRVKAAKP
jgi:hypothetical protein